MGIGAIIYAGELVYKRGKRKRQMREDRQLIEWLRPVHNATRHTAATEVGTPHVIVRRDGAVWAGPWKNDGRGFTRVPKNWWIFKSKEKAEQELESNEFLRHCTVEEAE